MKKIPYGVQSYERLITNNYYYVDKTPYIERLEAEGAPYLMFLRPRRFGKSLFLSMLECYYDINMRDQFETLFKDTYIGKHPTELHNTYLILKLDFSGIKTDTNLDDIKASFDSLIEDSIKNFYITYKDFTGGLECFNREIVPHASASDNFRKLCLAMSVKKIKIYLLIDEYDNFANNILMQHGKTTYLSTAQKGGFIRSFFACIKAGTSNSTIHRLFMTGVTPMLLSDMTSGFNIALNLSLEKKYHDMVGFTQAELEEILDYYISNGAIQSAHRDNILDTCQAYYNNYRFSEDTLETIYNSNLTIFYLNHYILKGNLHNDLLDKNILTDYAKLRALVINDRHLNGNYSVLTELATTGETTSKLIDIFPMEAVTDTYSFKSLLFYLGLVTIKETLPTGHFKFTIPNQTIKNIQLDYISKALAQAFDFKFKSSALDENMLNMFLTGDALPALKTITDTFYDCVSLRDFIDRELSFKAYLLAYLNLSSIYCIFSEREFNKGYADIYLEPNLNLIEKSKFCFLIELKYIQAKNRTEKNISDLEEQATAQLAQYSQDIYFKDKALKKIILILSSTQIEVLKEID